VIGVNINNHAKAYDWNELVKKKIIQDSVAGVPLLFTIKNDERTFYALNRKTSKGVLHFSYDNGANVLHDDATNSTWNINGVCIDGVMKGEQLKNVQAYQEFWHSWKAFHPNTEQYR
jgi:hypothetical protein